MAPTPQENVVSRLRRRGVAVVVLALTVLTAIALPAHADHGGTWFYGRGYANPERAWTSNNSTLANHLLAKVTNQNVPVAQINECGGSGGPAGCPTPIYSPYQTFSGGQHGVDAHCGKDGPHVLVGNGLDFWCSDYQMQPLEFSWTW